MIQICWLLLLDVDAKLFPKHSNFPLDLKLIRSELFRDASEGKKNIGNLAPCLTLILPFLAFNFPKRETLFWVEFFVSKSLHSHESLSPSCRSLPSASLIAFFSHNSRHSSSRLPYSALSKCHPDILPRLPERYQ